MSGWAENGRCDFEGKTRKLTIQEEEIEKANTTEEVSAQHTAEVPTQSSAS